MSLKILRIAFFTIAFALFCTTAEAQICQPTQESPPAATEFAERKPIQNKRLQVSVTWDDRPAIRFGTVARIDLRVRLQADSRGSDASLDVPADLMWASRRVGLDGVVGGKVRFQIEREFVSDDPWRDVYLNYQQFDAFQIQAGKFKLPFSLDETTSAANLDFVHRSRVADQLAPGRDRGVMLHGRLLNRAITYEAGVFEHDGNNARRRNPKRVYGGRTVAARVTARPWRRARSVASTLDFGAAFASSDVPTGYSSLEGETAFGWQFYEPDLWVSGPIRRTGVELRWRPGPLSIKSEYVRVASARERQSVSGTDLSPLLATGWYVSGTWIVTGESKAAGPSQPRRSVLDGGPGAIELATRVEELRFASRASGDSPSTGSRADNILGNRLRALTAGVNWYPSRWFKVQINVIRESILYPDHGPVPARPAFWSRVLRVQIAF